MLDEIILAAENSHLDNSCIKVTEKRISKSMSHFVFCNFKSMRKVADRYFGDERFWIKEKILIY